MSELQKRLRLESEALMGPIKVEIQQRIGVLTFMWWCRRVQWVFRVASNYCVQRTQIEQLNSEFKIEQNLLAVNHNVTGAGSRPMRTSNQ